MKQVQISEFKAKCVGLLKEAREIDEPFEVTLRGQPIAVITPISKERFAGPKLGAMEGTIEILGDIVNFSSEDDWDALK